MNIGPHYVTFSEYPTGLGHACDPGSFDDACDAYAECRDDDRDAVVMRYDPPVGGACGIMTDVTEDAVECILRRYRQRGWDYPEWILEAA